MAFVNVKKGLKATLPAAGSQETGVIYYVTDTGEIWLEGKQYTSAADIAEIQRALTGYLNQDPAVTVAGALTAAIEALDGSATIASVSNNVVTIKAGISETDGVVSNNSDSDIVLEEVAYTGAAADVSIADAGSLITATDVEGALQELAQASAGGVASKTVYITETAGSSSDTFSKRYGIYQGSTGSSSSPVAGEKLTDIDIPKDMVVESGTVVDITYDNGKLYDGVTDVTDLIKGSGGTATSADAGKYIKLVIANASSSALYIAAKDLVDIYTGGTNSETTVTIDNSNEITVSINDITASKLSYSAGSETVEAALARLDGADTVTGSVAKKIKDAVEALDAIADSTKTEINGSTARTKSNDDAVFALQAVTEADGKLSAMTVVEAAQIGTGTGRSGSGTELDPYVYDDTIIGAKKYAEDKAAAAGSAAIESLDVSDFALGSVTSNVLTLKGIKEVDGKIAASADTTKDIVFEEVAITGAAADVSIADAGFYTSQSTVEGALQEIYGALTWGTF